MDSNFFVSFSINGFLCTRHTAPGDYITSEKESSVRATDLQLNTSARVKTVLGFLVFYNFTTTFQKVTCLANIFKLYKPKILILYYIDRTLLEYYRRKEEKNLETKIIFDSNLFRTTALIRKYLTITNF